MIPALAAVTLGTAALLGVAAVATRRAALEGAVRVFGIVGAALLVPALADPGGRAWAALAAAAALLAPRPLPLLLGCAAATGLALGSPPASHSAAAVWSCGLARLAAGADPAWSAVPGGAGLVALLLWGDGGRILRWRYGLGPVSARLEIPGAAILFGLALLAALAGTLLLAADLLTRRAAAAPARARVLARRLLILAATLGALGTGFAAFRAATLQPAVLESGALPMAGLIAAVGALVVGLMLLLSDRIEADAPRLTARAAVETRLAASLAVAAALTSGYEGWLRQATYATRLAEASCAAALLGLAAIEPTRLALGRRAALLAGLVYLLSS